MLGVKSMENKKIKIINLVENTDGKNGCEYEHGFSFYIETPKHKLLVDSGATDMFLRNGEKLQIDLEHIDTLILSHGHYDHAGGIIPFSKRNTKANIYMQKTAGEDYYSITNETEKYIGIDKEILELPQTILVNQDRRIDDELFLFSNITGRKYFAKGNLRLKKKTEEGLVQDNFEHEQCLVITVEKMSILVSGCAHNGILNILERYYEIFQSYPHVVISGFHTMQKEPYSKQEIQNIENMAKELLDTKAVFYTGHCTGAEAYEIMKKIMGEKLQWVHSGTRIK